MKKSTKIKNGKNQYYKDSLPPQIHLYMQSNLIKPQ